MTTTLRLVELAGRAVTLEIAEAGAGGRPLLLVHGFSGTKRDFTEDGWLDRLADVGWHAVAVDQRGHGASEKPAGVDAYSFPILAADLVALVGALGWSRVTLLGHSMGGMVAQFVALSTDLLDGLILMDTSHSRPGGLDPEMMRLGRSLVEEGGTAKLVATTNELGINALGTPAHERLCAEREGYVEFGEAGTLAASADMWVAMLDAMLDQDDRLPALAALDLPTLVIAGEQDSGFVDQCRALAATIPCARLEIIAEAGHSPQFEAPEAFWDALSGFLSIL